MSHELAKERALKTAMWSWWKACAAKLRQWQWLPRIRPLKVMDKTMHLVGMPFCFGWSKPKCGDSTNRVTVSIGDPNTTIPEYKACLVNLYKAEKVTEL